MKAKKKGGRFLKQKAPKRRFGWIILVLLMIAGTLALFFFAQSTEDSDETTVPVQPSETNETTTVPTETTEPDPLAVYGYIFDLYAQAVAEDWDYEQCEKNRVCYMVMFLDSLDSLGFYLVDMNGDGISELLISDGNVIYAMHAQVRGHVMGVFLGAERNSWQLCENNIIMNMGSNGAASTVYDFYIWDGAKPVLERNITFNGMNEDPWTTTYNGVTEVLSEDQAYALIEAYGHVEIPMEAFPE